MRLKSDVDVMPLNYVLIGQTPVPEPDSHKWAEWFATADRTVAQTEIGASLISTVFLGVDRQVGHGPPLLFETMVFCDGESEIDVARCSTWLEADKMHKRMVEKWSIWPKRKQI